MCDFPVTGDCTAGDADATENSIGAARYRSGWLAITPITVERLEPPDRVISLPLSSACLDSEIPRGVFANSGSILPVELETEKVCPRCGLARYAEACT